MKRSNEQWSIIIIESRRIEYGRHNKLCAKHAFDRISWTFSFIHLVDPRSLNDRKHRFSRLDSCDRFEYRIETGQRLDVSISTRVPVPSNLACSDKDTKGLPTPCILQWFKLMQINDATSLSFDINDHVRFGKLCMKTARTKIEVMLPIEDDPVIYIETISNIFYSIYIVETL